MPISSFPQMLYGKRRGDSLGTIVLMITWYVPSSEGGIQPPCYHYLTNGQRHLNKITNQKRDLVRDKGIHKLVLLRSMAREQIDLMFPNRLGQPYRRQIQRVSVLRFRWSSLHSPRRDFFS